MGYDVTWHPVSEAELLTYVYAPCRDPGLVPRCIELLANDEAAAEFLADGIYDRLPAFRATVEQSRSEFASTIAFAAAAIAGHLHPYWYIRGGSLSFAAEDVPALRRLLSSPGVGTEYAGLGGALTGNYSAGAYIRHGDLDALEAVLTDRAAKKALAQHVGEVPVLLAALRYARERGLGLLEATDLVVPGAGECASEYGNLRATYLKNVKVARSVRRATVTPRSAADCAALCEAHADEIARGEVAVKVQPDWIAALPMAALERLAVGPMLGKEALATSPATPAAILDRLARDPEEPPRRPWPVLMLCVAENPSAAPDTLTWCARAAGGKGTLMRIAENPASPDAALRIVAEAKQAPAAHMRLVTHPNASVATLTILAANASAAIRKAALARIAGG